MRIRRIRAVAQKEYRHIFRDPRSLIMALAIPLVMLLLFGFALSLDVDRIPTLIYDADGSAPSRELIHRFGGSRFFKVEGIVDNYHTIEKAIDRGDVLMALAIPRGYGRSVAAGRRAELQILVDGSDSNTASIALGYAQSLARTYSYELRSDLEERRTGRRPAPPVDARSRVWYNSSLESKNYVVPGLTAVILMIIASLLTSLTIAREWESGTMEPLLSTPLRPAELVLGKMLAFFGVGIGDTVIAVTVALVVFHVPLRGSVLLLFFTTSIFLAGALFWGIFISAVAKSQLLAYQMGILSSFLPSLLLSGFVFGIESMPSAIQIITHVVPARYLVAILKGIFLKGVGLHVLWLEVVFLAVYAAAVFILATRKLEQKLA